jgi:hypothetical protein
MPQVIILALTINRRRMDDKVIIRIMKTRVEPTDKQLQKMREIGDLVVRDIAERRFVDLRHDPRLKMVVRGKGVESHEMRGFRDDSLFLFQFHLLQIEMEASSRIIEILHGHLVLAPDKGRHYGRGHNL